MAGKANELLILLIVKHNQYNIMHLYILLFLVQINNKRSAFTFSLQGRDGGFTFWNSAVTSPRGNDHASFLSHFSPNNKPFLIQLGVITWEA